MKQLVNGKEADLGDGAGAVVTPLDDRLSVASEGKTATAVAVRSGDATLVSYRGRTFRVERARRKSTTDGAGSGEVRSPMPGQIVEVACAGGEAVEDGQRLMVLEAMKMQQQITAPFSGSIESVNVSQGDQVEEGQLLLVVHGAP
ncbi:MAG TPA: biotin/lipoyl-containing protein [Fimbriimonadaceae bacterium]|nr:biotin/lipoyl-containing protein [Fimbriimonadaceae bacterium]